MKIGNGADWTTVQRRALREAELIIKLDHPNVVCLEGFVEDSSNGHIWLIFPWAELGNLRDFVATVDWKVPERIWLIDDVARGVEYLHTQDPPIRHGDLKSTNILVNFEYRALITDFGSACQARHAGDRAGFDLARCRNQGNHDGSVSAEYCPDTNTITLTGTTYTLRWVAPEILRDEKGCTKSDIWSMGWVFYEIMTGFIPFENVKKDTEIIQWHIVKGALPALTDDERMSTIQQLISLMVKCWEWDPHKRPTADICRKSIHWMPMCVPGVAQSSVRLLIEQGHLYGQQNEHDKAIGAFSEALNVLGPEALNEEKAEALWGLAEIHRLLNEYDESVLLYPESARIYDHIGNREGKANSLRGLAHVHRLRDEYTEAIDLYSESTRLYQEIEHLGGRANCLWGLAEVYRFQYDYPKASSLYSKSSEICDRIGDRGGKALSTRGLAEIYRLQGMYTQAVSHYSESIRIFDEIGDQGGKANAVWGLADVHRLQGEFNSAIELYHESAEIFKHIRDRGGMGNTLWGLAEVHRRLAQYAEASTFYSECVQIFDEIGDRSGRADALCGLAEVHRFQADHAEAASLHSESAKAYGEIGNQPGRARALRGLAQVRRVQNEHSESLQIYGESAEICRGCGDRLGLAHTLSGIADVLRDQGNEDDAIKLFNEASLIFHEIDSAMETPDGLSVANLRDTLLI